MSTALIIGGVVLGVAVLAGISMMGKKREVEDTFYGAENQNPNEEDQSGGRRSRTRSRRSRSRRSKRVKI